MRSSRPSSRSACSTHGVYVIGFSFPVVPQGKARIRTQMSAAHTREQLDRRSHAFATVGKELGVIDDCARRISQMLQRLDAARASSQS